MSIQKQVVWEHSSVGRASALQAGGHRFEPCCSHQTNLFMDTREWLSGRALPCQGKCREFESRFPLHFFLQLTWYHSQAVRQRSAKPLRPGSNPGGTSNVAS